MDNVGFYHLVLVGEGTIVRQYHKSASVVVRSLVFFLFRLSEQVLGVFRIHPSTKLSNVH